MAPRQDATIACSPCNDLAEMNRDHDFQPSATGAVALDPAAIKTVLCDLDGVIWLGHQPIEGSSDAVAELRAGGCRVLFVTNNSRATVADVETALDAVGVPAVGDVVSSAMAAALLVKPGERVLVAGGEGVVEACQERGATVVVNDGTTAPGPVDAVVVGLHRDFDYYRMMHAASAVRDGARLIGTNDDATFPTPTGQAPGGGAILAAIVTAAGVEPVIAGKPHAPMATLISTVLSSPAAPFDPREALMVGDRPETDGLFAAQLGCPFALVRTGVIAPGEDPGISVSLDLANLAELPAVLKAGESERP